jgi:hypothetical protein
MQLFPSTIQYELKILYGTKLHHYRTEKTASVQTFASFAAEMSVACTLNLPLLFC